jgi:hypothetical protein
MMTATPTEIMFRFPYEISNHIVSFMGQTPTAKLMHEKTKEYDYIYGSCNDTPFVDFIHYVLHYQKSIKQWNRDYHYYKQKYNFITQNVEHGGDLIDGSIYEGIFDDSDEDHSNDQQEQDIVILQEEIIETETDFEDLCPTIYDFYKLNMYCHEFSYTIEYFYKYWVEDLEDMKEKLNTFQPMFGFIW